MEMKILCCGQEEVITHLAGTKRIPEVWRNMKNNESNNTTCQCTSGEIFIFQNVLPRKYFMFRTFCKTLNDIHSSGKIPIAISILKIRRNLVGKISIFKVYFKTKNAFKKHILISLSFHMEMVLIN